MSAPAVSVVMSVFNGERFLAEAIESILGQTFRDFEFLIVNDGSRDGTAEILERYRGQDARIRIVAHENRGLISALNGGIAQALGRYIARMDADDIAVAERLALQVAYMEQHPEVALLGGAVEFIDEAGRSLGFRSNPTESAEIRGALLDRNVIWHPTVFAKRDAVVAAGGYRNVPLAEDYDLWLRMADGSALGNLETVVLRYRMHAQQATVQQNERMSLSALTSRGAALARRAGMVDPLDSVVAITPGTLARLVGALRPLTGTELRATRTEEQSARLRSYLRWILQVGEVADERCWSNAIEALDPRSWQGARREEMADLQYTAARLHWGQGNYLRGASAASQAVFRQPVILGRALKPLLRLVRGETRKFDLWGNETS